MKTPPPDKPFDPDDPNLDPWADDPNAPKEPGYFTNAEDDDDDEDDKLPWSEDDSDLDDEDDSDEYEFPLTADDELPTPQPEPVIPPPPGVLGPAALFDSQLRGEIEFEILFQQTKAAFFAHQPDPKEAIPSRYVQWPVILALAVWGAVVHGWLGFVCVIGAKFLHELGHFIAQRGFGYREHDLPNVMVPNRWLPKATAATSTQRAITFLAGPLPGLLLAFVLQTVFVPEIDGVLQFFVLILLAFNLADLWVTNISDGGRFFERIPFLRGTWACVIARAFGVGLLVAAAIAVTGILLKALLAVFAVLVVVGTVRSWRIARSRQALERIFDHLPENTRELTDAQLRTMLNIVLTLGPTSFEPADLARAMHTVHERAARPLMPRPTSLALFLTYLLAWLLLLNTCVFVFNSMERHRQVTQNLLRAFQGVIDAPPRDRERALRECEMQWESAEPKVRRDAGRRLDLVLESLPEKPEALSAFVERLKAGQAK